MQKQDADLHFSKIMVATLWRTDYGGRVGAEGPLSVLQVSNDGGFTQSGGGDATQGSTNPS